jgi:arylsulfatase A-like enzyme
LIWNWPGRIPVQSVRPELVSTYDVMPTVCDLTGATLPARNLCGRSYQPLLLNHPLPKKNPWRNTLFAQLRNTEMARDPRFKLVLRNNGDGPNELYDMRADSREKVNLYESPQHVTVRQRLTAELEAWRKKYA